MATSSSIAPWFSQLTYSQCAAGLLTLHLLLLGWIAYWNAPVCDEVGHLTAGIYQWHHGKFFLYRVNPPLVKLVAAIPAAFGGAKYDWSDIADGPGVRMEFDVGQDFLAANRPHGAWYFTAGRLLCLPFTVLGGWMCFLWGRLLYGPLSGLVACLLWCVSPTVLGWGSVFTPDAAAASFGLLAAYLFRHWLVELSWRAALQAGIGFGLCQLTKMTWIVLFGLWPLIWLSCRLWQPKRTSPWTRELAQLGLLIGTGLFVLNIGYGFEGSLRQLGNFDFVSSSLTGLEQTGQIGNRFRGTLLAVCLVPLPYNYVRGIDLQKVDFERGMESYLFGTWSDRGWWYYYPLAACLKLPLGTLCLLLVVVFSHLIPGGGMKLSRDEYILMIPALVIFILVCSQTGFGRYIRYLLPSLPAVFILISKLWSMAWPPIAQRAGYGLMGWIIFSSLSIYPHSMSYFNELAGGPLGGHRYLLDANIDWGQDLMRLKHWIKEHPEAQPLYCIQTGFVSPFEIGIECRWPAKMTFTPDGATQSIVPEPGWYAVSVHELFQRHGYYRYLQKYHPVDRVGYSMWIYHIPPAVQQTATPTAR